MQALQTGRPGRTVPADIRMPTGIRMPAGAKAWLLPDENQIPPGRFESHMLHKERQ